MALPLLHSRPSWNDYESAFVEQLIRARDELGADAAVFGDIDVQTAPGLGGTGLRPSRRGPDALLFPLWEINRRKLVEDMIAAGQRAKVVSCNERLGESFLGRVLDAQTLIDLEAAGVDACGENGEYHSYVFDCHGFSRPIVVREGRRYQKRVPRKTRPSDDWYLELQLA
jgi:diphthamide synthase (EF-2-diphthine--ammonia ligase)